MNLIRPQILISASLISLALLVVSATPIPSSSEDVFMSGVNDDFPADSIPLSEHHASSATASPQAFSVNKGLLTIKSKLQGYTSDADAPPADENTKKELLREMKLLKASMEFSKGAIDVHSVGLEISRAIRTVKVFVSKWAFDHYKQNAVQAIEECEEEMINKRFTRDIYSIDNELAWYQKQLSMKEVDMTTRLPGLVGFVSGLTLNEQRTKGRREKLQALIEQAKGKIDKADKTQMVSLEKLKNLDLLLDIPPRRLM